MKTIKILIADDHHLVAESLCMLLSTVQDFQILNIINNGWQALEYIKNNDVDIALTDYHMPLLNSIEMTVRMKTTSPNTRSIMLTMSEKTDYIQEALRVGVYGYVMKSAEKSELIHAIRTVAQGNKYFSSRIMQKLVEMPNLKIPNSKPRLENVIPTLTKREIEILKLVSEDLSNLEIGNILYISGVTVETHRRNLMKKIGVNSAIGLMRWGIKNGLVVS